MLGFGLGIALKIMVPEELGHVVVPYLAYGQFTFMSRPELKLRSVLALGIRLCLRLWLGV